MSKHDPFMAETKKKKDVGRCKKCPLYCKYMPKLLCFKIIHFDESSYSIYSLATHPEVHFLTLPDTNDGGYGNKKGWAEKVGGLMDCILSLPGSICVADEPPSLTPAPAPRLVRHHPLSLLIPTALLTFVIMKPNLRRALWSLKPIQPCPPVKCQV